MKLGQLKAIYRQLDRTTDAESLRRLYVAEAVWLADLAVWTPSTPREIVRACAIMRYFLAYAQVPDGEALGELRACLSGIAVCVRRRRPAVARAMRLIVQQGARAGLDPAHDGPECDVLAAIARAARPGAGLARPYRDVRALARRAL